jgi:hypothetical protein
MAERTRMLHGSFDLQSVPGAGASVCALFPIIAKAETAKAETTIDDS